jgi:hypothetical protein
MEKNLHLKNLRFRYRTGYGRYRNRSNSIVFSAGIRNELKLLKIKDYKSSRNNIEIPDSGFNNADEQMSGGSLRGPR